MRALALPLLCLLARPCGAAYRHQLPPTTCSGHGAIARWGGKLACFCEQGWHGRDCDMAICSRPCVFGRCAAPERCECAPGDRKSVV